MIQQYFVRAGITDLNVTGGSSTSHIVDEAIALNVHNLSEKEKRSLYTYFVPELGPNGSCSIQKTLAKDPYDLTPIASLVYTKNEEAYTVYLQQLQYIVASLQKITGVDWLGVYRKITLHGTDVLVKESYSGIPSRGEFPLTEDFAKTSNNSRVGITGKAVYFQNLSTYAGPYYECDSKVQSECCLPIFSADGEIIGIIDAESAHTDFFTPQRIIELATVADDIKKLMKR